MIQGPSNRTAVAIAFSLLLHAALFSVVADLPHAPKSVIASIDIQISQVAKLPSKETGNTPAHNTAPRVVPLRQLKRARRQTQPPAAITPPPQQVPGSSAAEPPPAVNPNPEDSAPDSPEAPPVLDMADGSFGPKDGAARWALSRSEGNSQLAALAANNAKSARGTRSARVPGGIAGGTGTGPVRAADLSRRPSPFAGEFEIPTYPLPARQAGIEGEVVLKVFIDHQGQVRAVKVVSDPGGGLGQTAKNTMLRERWTIPLDRNGQPVATVVTYKYRFELTG